jgi:hypothetical protein
VTGCAYCGAQGPLTREHLWPKSLHQRLLNTREEKSSLFWLAKIKKEIPNEPTVRDVCATCNNTILSKLDNYIGKLFDQSFVRILKRNEKIEFQYDYHRLKRWLLKISFNSARIHSSVDAIVYQSLLPYIRGETLDLGRSVQLFCLLSYPAKVPEEFLEPGDEQSWIVFPDIHRVGLAWFAPEGVGRKMLRAVHLRSFSFFLAFWRSSERQSEIDVFTKCFLERYTGSVLLRASRTRETLVCNGVSAWDSIAGARSTFEWSE